MLQAISDWSLVPRSAAWRWAFAAIACLVAFGLRYWLEGALPPGFPYLTFFPAVILTTFFAGLWPGVAAAVTCGLLAWFLFIAPVHSFALSGASGVALAFYAFITSTEIVILHLMNRAMAGLQAERRRSAELAEARKLMFHELQHRVSNNLSAVASLLKMQRRKVGDPAAQRALDEAVGRIALVARMQRMLHDPGAQQIDLARFLHDMTHDVLQSTGTEGRIAHRVETCPVVIGPDQSIPLGLIATEFLSNAVEHGFPGDRTGRVEVRLAVVGDRALLEVRDNGVGLPEGFAIEATGSLGLQIARQFAQQIGAELTMAAGDAGGTVSRLLFPLDEAGVLA